MKPIKIPLCCIVKDDTEAKQLEAMLDTIQPYVDDVYLTVTNENTPGIDSLAKRRGIHLSRFRWIDDFSAARNFNFSQAPQDADYILWCDADDLWIGGDMVKEVARITKEAGFDVVFFTYWYACTFNGQPSLDSVASVDIQHLRERLIRPGTNTWKGRLHETPVPVDGAKMRYTSYAYSKEQPVCVVHTATDDILPAKMERNKRILEAQLEEERSKGEADPRTLLYLAKIYAENGTKEEMAKVLVMGEEYLAKSGWDEERGVCWEQMGICHAKLGNEREAARAFHNAIQEWPHQPLFYLRLAQSYYNLKLYRQSQHWLEVGMRVEIDDKSGNLVNYKAMKLMASELLLNLEYNVRKNVDKAVEAAKLVYRENPTENNLQNLNFLQDLKDLNQACLHADKLAEYLDSIGQKDRIIPLLDQLPQAITSQPFAVRLRHWHANPRKWGDNEICYFANFGQKHFEQWDPTSLNKGIGGSETAVIRLAQEWTRLGYKVTVYGDPIKSGDYDGVTYLPWYHFNPKDRFNIFIQWRNWRLAGEVKARKFYVDLHDVWNGVDVGQEQLKHIDAFMVKSKFHRDLAPNIPDYKFKIISNGI